MKVIAMMGSPHEDGPSSTLVRRFLEGAKDAGHEIVAYECNKMDIKDCQGCGYCKNNAADCIVNDDLKPYWKELHECGALIVSSPNYCSSVTGGMITYMNRHYCLLDKDWKVRLHPGVKLVGVFAQGSPEMNETTQHSYKWFLADFQNRSMVLEAMLVHHRGMPLEIDSPLMVEAYNLGKNL